MKAIFWYTPFIFIQKIGVSGLKVPLLSEEKKSCVFTSHQDYGNWSFSLLTQDFDLWDDERHSQKALITGEMASLEIYFMAH